MIQEIANLAQTGQVRINDIEWTARSADDEKIGEGTVVTVSYTHRDVYKRQVEIKDKRIYAK